MRILIADDNIDALESLAMLLERNGHEVYRAQDGEFALHAAQTFKPEAAILDIAMPGLSGYGVARQIRSEVWGRRTLLIAHTAWGGPDNKQRALKAGFDRHLTKPADFSEIVRLLDEGTEARGYL